MKRLVLIAAAVIGLLALVALVVPLFVDFDHYKPQLEAAASDALGMEVRVTGRLSMGLLPGLHVAAKESRVLDEQGVTVTSAERIRLGIALLPLFRRELRLSSVDIDRPVFSVVRDAEGQINVERLRKAMLLLGALDGSRMSVTGGTVRYVDMGSADTTEVTGLTLKVKRLRFGRRDIARPGGDLSLHAELACGEIRTPLYVLTDLMTTVRGDHGIIRLEPVTLDIFGAQMTGDVQADFSGPVPLCRIQCSLPHFAIENFLMQMSPERAVEGTMDFSAKLTAQGGTMSQMVQTLSGEMSLRGSDLTLVNNDIDLALSRFESSQSFSLVDVGAVFLAGPLGVAVTRGYNFASLFRGTGGSSTIGTLVSDWKVERGVATAEDVAMATRENRIALKGGLDFANGRFVDLTVAVIDEKGCATVRQQITGSFESPVVEKPNILVSLTGPVLGLYRRTRALLPGGPCELFYSGSVAAPE